MAYKIRIEPNAMEHLEELPIYYRRVIFDAIYEQLTHEPETETRNRIPMRPNAFARWELRVGDYRVFYDVIESDKLVRVLAVGVKVHNRLTIAGREVQL